MSAKSEAHDPSVSVRRRHLPSVAGEEVMAPFRNLPYPAGSCVLNVSLNARMARKEIAAAAMIMKAGL